MRLSELENWGIPVRVIAQWQKRQGETLLPVQARAVRKGLLGRRGEAEGNGGVRMVLSAPTSSGKSFCAEMAAVKALMRREKTVMLFPLKSLVEQKHELFERTYGELGVSCLIVTGDHPENDRRFRDGDYQIAVVIYEKIDQLLTVSLDALKNIGLVVVDEIQSIAEPGRGAVLERLLTKLRASNYSPSILALSAVIGDDTGSAGLLANWLRATLVEENMRPVELMRGVAAEGCYRYRLFNEGHDGTEPFVLTDPGDDNFDNFIRQVKETEAATLVFLKSRGDTVEAAFRLAAQVRWPEASKALAALQDEEPSFLIRSLRQALSRGVAFHNSDLSSSQRQVVEQAFLDKEVKVIFSTTTLAMGVNLFADVVYLETVKYTGGTYDHRPSLVPVTRSEFDNMTGRAGRLGQAGNPEKPGRAIIIADNEFDRDILWQNYIAGDGAEPVRSAFRSMPLEDWLLDLTGCGLIDRCGKVHFDSLLEHSLYGFSGHAASDAEYENALKVLVDEGLVITDDNNPQLRITAQGRAALNAGFSVSQTVHYRGKLSAGYPETLPGWLALALSSPGWDLPPAIISRREQLQNLPLKMLCGHFDLLLDEARWLLGNHDFRQTLPYRQAAALKAFLLLHLWQDLTPVQSLEEQFQIHLGQILGLGETAAYLVRGIAEIVQASEGLSSPAGRLRDYAWALRFGLPVDMRTIRDRLGELLTRRDFHALRVSNVSSIADFVQSGSEILQTTIKDEHRLSKISERINQIREEYDMYSKSAVVENHQAMFAAPISGKPESIEIDGAFERERYLVRINGFPVRLTGKSFKYFTKLAWSRLNRDSGWIYKEDIEVGFNQARYLYRMKGEISSGLNISWPVIENNRLGYYRLNAEPGAIRLNVENLRQHPDYEVRSLFLN